MTVPGRRQDKIFLQLLRDIVYNSTVHLFFSFLEDLDAAADWKWLPKMKTLIFRPKTENTDPNLGIVFTELSWEIKWNAFLVSRAKIPTSPIYDEFLDLATFNPAPWRSALLTALRESGPSRILVKYWIHRLLSFCNEVYSISLITFFDILTPLFLRHLFNLVHFVGLSKTINFDLQSLLSILSSTSPPWFAKRSDTLFDIVSSWHSLEYTWENPSCKF